MERVVEYKRTKPEGIQRHHIISAMFYMEMIKVQYTEDVTRSWEEFNSAVIHFKFVDKYIQLPRI